MTHLRYLLLALPTLLLLAPAVAEEKKPEAGFVPLFDGKTLKGWVPMNAAPGTFFVKDGMLITTGKPTGLLRSAKQYENFILEAEWMHVVKKGNSGIFVWADPLPAVGSQFTRAIEVQVLDGLETKNYTSDGDLFSVHGAKFTPDRPHPSGWPRCLPSEKRCKPAGNWNHYRVTCKDGTIKLAVNGKEVSGGSKITPRKGYICIESEGSECRFRNLKIKELPSTKPKPEDCCPLALGHTTLFTGLNLDGWIHEMGWRTGDNLLTYAGVGRSTIATKKEFADFELVIDVKVPKDTTVTARMRGAKGIPVRFGEKDTIGKWRRYVFTVKGNSVSYPIGDKVLKTEASEAAKRGPIMLEANGPVEFRNIFIRELK
jgi:hypothetical protein